MRYSAIYTLIGLMFFGGCQSTLDLDQSTAKEVLVVDGVFSNQGQWNISISRTLSIFEKDAEHKIDDAIVTVINLDENTATGLNSIGNGEYVSRATKPQIGKKYKISVFHEDYPTAHGVAHVPKNQNNFRIDTSVVFVNDQRALKIDFSFENENSEDNFYVWDILKSSSGIKSGSGSFDAIASNGESVEASLIATVDDFEPVVSDKLNQSQLFLSNTVSDSSTIENSFLSTHDGYYNNEDPNVKYYVRMRTVSEDLYKYLQSIEKYRIRGDVNSSEVIPSDIYTNINNGRGIFAGYSESIVEL